MSEAATKERTRNILSDKRFKGTRFSINRGEGATYDAGPRKFMVYRDLGIAEATGGAYDAKIVKANPAVKERAAWHKHELEFQMVFVLKGWIKFEYEGVGHVTLYPGDCMHQAPGIKHIEIDHSDDYEGIELTCPGRFQTVEVDPPR